uniref:Nephrocystin 3-like N-terminal domain-containing protein n=1 Tax=Chromera velia CCMP2878 TaxID=1169474 RepID=A0A0G4I2V3_9ALVE|eukprot:Cvel_10469.t1-p1 / transcript=Cvel_10469.t1 / gene=Cvel_10469 / organism=Chromera_velia_CCMP2878 / gene_product=Tankyrase-1, putative / transcript_product=Tankyrase-1, putative / location=Cvel_scaffold631:19432-43435(-) / protein_length=2585 / sequence_SO=supercontig / SO=protein_coding / is_pseudo=false
MPVTDVDILRAISLALAPLACAREPAEATSSVSADLRSNVDFFDRMPPPAKHNVLLRLWNAMMNTLHRNVKNGKAVILPGVGTLLPGEVLSSVPVIAGGGMRGSVLFCPDAAFRCAESCAVVSPSVVLHMPPAAQYLERVCVKPKTASTAAGVSASLCEGLWAEFVRLLRATTDRGHTAVLGLSVGVVSLSRKAVRFTSKPIVQTASSPLGAALVKAGSLSLSHDGAAGSVQRETLCGHGGPLSSAVSAPTASLALPPLSLSGTAAGVSSLEKKIDRGDREGSQLSSLTVADLEARIQPRKSRKPRSTIGPGEERAAAAENESIRRERDKRALAERQSSRERAYRQRDAVRTAIVTGSVYGLQNGFGVGSGSGVFAERGTSGMQGDPNAASPWQRGYFGRQQGSGFNLSPSARGMSGDPLAPLSYLGGPGEDSQGDVPMHGSGLGEAFLQSFDRSSSAGGQATGGLPLYPLEEVPPPASGPSEPPDVPMGQEEASSLQLQPQGGEHLGFDNSSGAAAQETEPHPSSNLPAVVSTSDPGHSEPLGVLVEYEGASSVQPEPVKDKGGRRFSYMPRVLDDATGTTVIVWRDSDKSEYIYRHLEVTATDPEKPERIMKAKCISPTCCKPNAELHRTNFKGPDMKRFLEKHQNCGPVERAYAEGAPAAVAVAAAVAVVSSTSAPCGSEPPLPEDIGEGGGLSYPPVPIERLSLQTDSGGASQASSSLVTALTSVSQCKKHRREETQEPQPCVIEYRVLPGAIQNVCMYGRLWHFVSRTALPRDPSWVVHDEQGRLIDLQRTQCGCWTGRMDQALQYAFLSQTTSGSEEAEWKSALSERDLVVFSSVRPEDPGYHLDSQGHPAVLESLCQNAQPENIPWSQGLTLNYLTAGGFYRVEKVDWRLNDWCLVTLLSYANVTRSPPDGRLCFFSMSLHHTPSEGQSLLGGGTQVQADSGQSHQQPGNLHPPSSSSSASASASGNSWGGAGFGHGNAWQGAPAAHQYAKETGDRILTGREHPELQTRVRPLSLEGDSKREPAESGVGMPEGSQPVSVATVPVSELTEILTLGLQALRAAPTAVARSDGGVGGEALQNSAQGPMSAGQATTIRLPSRAATHPAVPLRVLLELMEVGLREARAPKGPAKSSAEGAGIRSPPVGAGGERGKDKNTSGLREKNVASQSTGEGGGQGDALREDRENLQRGVGQNPYPPISGVNSHSLPAKETPSIPNAQKASRSVVQQFITFDNDELASDQIRARGSTQQQQSILPWVVEKTNTLSGNTNWETLKGLLRLPESSAVPGDLGIGQNVVDSGRGLWVGGGVPALGVALRLCAVVYKQLEGVRLVHRGKSEISTVPGNVHESEGLKGLSEEVKGFQSFLADFLTSLLEEPGDFELQPDAKSAIAEDLCNQTAQLLDLLFIISHVLKENFDSRKSFMREFFSGEGENVSHVTDALRKHLVAARSGFAWNANRAEQLTRLAAAKRDSRISSASRGAVQNSDTHPTSEELPIARTKEASGPLAAVWSSFGRMYSSAKRMILGGHRPSSSLELIAYSDMDSTASVLQAFGGGPELWRRVCAEKLEVARQKDAQAHPTFYTAPSRLISKQLVAALSSEDLQKIFPNTRLPQRLIQDAQDHLVEELLFFSEGVDQETKEGLLVSVHDLRDFLTKVQCDHASSLQEEGQVTTVTVQKLVYCLVQRKIGAWERQTTAAPPTVPPQSTWVWAKGKQESFGLPLRFSAASATTKASTNATSPEKRSVFHPTRTLTTVSEGQTSDLPINGAFISPSSIDCSENSWRLLQSLFLGIFKEQGHLLEHYLAFADDSETSWGGTEKSERDSIESEVSRFLEGSGRVLCLVGSDGSGKSVAAARLVTQFRGPVRNVQNSRAQRGSTPSSRSQGRGTSSRRISRRALRRASVDSILNRRSSVDQPDVRRPEASVVSFFFGDRAAAQSNSAIQMLCALSLQASLRFPEMADDLREQLTQSAGTGEAEGNACEAMKAVRDGDLSQIPLVFEELLRKPLAKIALPLDRPILFALDGLDEIGVEETERQSLIHILENELPRLPPCIRFIITSTPSSEIRACLGRLVAAGDSRGPSGACLSLSVEEKNAARRKSLALTLARRFLPLSSVGGVTEKMQEEAAKKLFEAAGGSFRWLRVVGEKKLREISKTRNAGLRDFIEIAEGGGVEDVYGNEIMRTQQDIQKFSSDPLISSSLLKSLFRVFSILLALREPLKPEDVARLLGLGMGTGMQIVRAAQFIFPPEPHTNGGVLRLQKSAHEFLSGKPEFADPLVGHLMVFSFLRGVICRRLKNGAVFTGGLDRDANRPLTQYCLKHGVMHLNALIHELPSRRRKRTAEVQARDEQPGPSRAAREAESPTEHESASPVDPVTELQMVVHQWFEMFEACGVSSDLDRWDVTASLAEGTLTLPPVFWPVAFGCVDDVLKWTVASEGARGGERERRLEPQGGSGQVNRLYRVRILGSHTSTRRGFEVLLSALHVAAWFGQEETARVLVDLGAEVDISSEGQRESSKAGITPLSLAVEFGHTEMVKLLLDQKADVNRRAPSLFKASGLQPLISMAGSAGFGLIEDVLSQHGATA